MFIYIFILFANTILSVSIKHFDNPVKKEPQEIINSICLKHFRGCDIFLLEDYTNNITIFNTLIDTSSTFQPKISLLLSSYNHKSFDLVARKYNQCSLIIALMIKGENKLKQFQELLIKDLVAPTKPHYDHYIFLTLPQFLSDLYYLSTIAKLRFNLFIPLNLKSAKGYSFCKYCDKSPIKNVDLKEIMSLNSVFPDWTRNGHMIELRVSTPTKYPFVMELITIRENEWIAKRGTFKIALETTLPHFNFTFKIFPSPTNDSGKLLSTGIWDGVMGDILYGKADIGLSTSYNFYRYPVLGFSRGIQYIWATFVLGQPVHHYSWEAVFWPFGWDLWMSILVSLGIIIVSFRLIQRFVIYDNDVELPIMHIAFVLVGKEIPYPKATPARLLLCIWLFSCLVISNLYVSKIVGLLAFPVTQPQPSNFKQLINPKMGYRWGMVGAGNLYAHFKSSTSPVLKTVFDKMDLGRKALDCFTQTLHEKYACVTWKGTSDFMSHKNVTFIEGKSPLITSDDKTLFVPLGFAMQRNSILLPNFNRVIQMLVDSGQTDKWTNQDLDNMNRQKIHWQKETAEYGNEIDSSKSNLLSLHHLIGVFYILISGIIVSTLFCAIEVVMYFKRTLGLTFPFTTKD